MQPFRSSFSLFARQIFSNHATSFIGTSLLFFFLLGLSPAHSAIIAYDGFGYADGDIAGSNGGVGWGGSWTGTGTVVANVDLLYPSLGSTSGYFRTNASNAGAFRPLGAIQNTASATIWGSFLLQAEGSLTNYSGLSLFNGDSEKFFVGQRYNSTFLGMEFSNGTGIDTSFAIDTAPHNLVFAFVPNAGKVDAELWIDPVTGILAPTTAPDITIRGLDNFPFDTIRLQAGTGLADYDFDEIRLGSSYSEVAPLLVIIPETNSVYLMLLGFGSFLILIRLRHRY